MKKELPLEKVYGYLESGPTVLLTTCQKNHQNIMTMSWHMMVDFVPPLICCVVSNRTHTFKILRKLKSAF